MVQHLLNGLYMLFASALGVDEDVIEVHYHENVKLLCQDLVDVAMEGSWCIGQCKKHHLVLEIAIADPKGRFLFVSFLNPHLMVGIGQIEWVKR